MPDTGVGILTAEGKNALAKRFGSDLRALKQQLGGEIETVEELTRLTSSRLKKASFKVTLDDGRRFKLRRFNSAEDWSSVVALAPLLEKLNFSRLIFAHGMAAIEQWITGTSLTATDVTDLQMAWAGGLLGQVHGIKALPAAQRTVPADGESYLEGIRRHLAVLAEHEVLDSGFIRNLHEMARQAQPGCFDAGLIHGDFCAENMVVTDRGEIIVIDNESVRLGELDYDIARCWARWPMSKLHRTAFAEGYQRHRPLDGFNRHRNFWAIKSLSQTVSVRLRYGKPYQPALEALKRIGSREEDDPWPTP